MRIAPPVVLDASQQETLKQWARSRSLPARQVERAKVVLLAAAGRTDLEIAASLRITNQKAARWRKRFLSLGLNGLTKDAPRPGRKPAISARLKAEVVRKTTQSKPSNATHWSTRAKIELQSHVLSLDFPLTCFDAGEPSTNSSDPRSRPPVVDQR